MGLHSQFHKPHCLSISSSFKKEKQNNFNPWKTFGTSYFANLGPFSSTISSEGGGESSQVSNDTRRNQHISGQIVVDPLKHLRGFSPPKNNSYDASMFLHNAVCFLQILVTSFYIPVFFSAQATNQLLSSGEFLAT